MASKTYDPKCETLARDFLVGSKAENLVPDLARTIQEAIEDWFFDQQIDQKGATN